MSLTVVSYYARTLIKLFIALLFIYVLALIFKAPIKGAWELAFPSKDPPNPIYGKLDPIEFVAMPTNGQVDSFELNTVDGKLPTELPKNMKVYKYVPTFLSFEAGKIAQEAALALGFSELEIVSDYKADKFIWKDINTDATLTVDLASQSIDMYTPLKNISANYEQGSIDEASAKEMADEFFTKLGKFQDPLFSSGEKKTYLGRFVGERVVEAASTLEAQLVMFDYFRSINEIPIMGPDPTQGMIRVVFGKPRIDNLKLINPIVQIYENHVDQATEATYPIIPVAIAWQNVARGNGVIASVIPGNKSPFEKYQRTNVDKVTIEKIYLGYYDSKFRQEYLQPIYVFEGRYTSGVGGKGAITLYYPAIDGKYVKGATEEEQ